MALLDATPGRPLINYNYTDFAEGTGIVVLYGTHTKVQTTSHYILSKSILTSNEIETETLTASGTFINFIDLDFDMPTFNLPKNMEGTAYVNVPVSILAGAGREFYIIAKLRKESGGETEIANAQSETLLSDVGTNVIKKLLVKITVPLTHFKKGDILRLTIEGWGKTSGGNLTLTMGHDPKERTTTAFPGTGDYKVTTSLIAHIPFRLGI